MPVYYLMDAENPAIEGLSGNSFYDDKGENWSGTYWIMVKHSR